ncbi:hypothetical protein KCG44_07600 [Pacificimonas sp. WHA3]|uniref:Lipoprotein n=1 Tax=Pacificimonas pallii TaxID=2827236 RepID=A0ABS6SE11_9SPHN|nr:hypothetical protein [Pacificimonas pallii]MBV7256648.1 hypothetical protein [Pacificimonas pallii]
MKTRIFSAGIGLLLTACGGITPPSAQQREAARAALPPLIEGVAQSQRTKGRVIALRWDIDDLVLTPERWSWREVEVIAESTERGAEAVTTEWTVSLNPADLGDQVPASLSRQAWGLQMVCAEGGCITRSGTRTTILDGERTIEVLPEERVRRAEWLFEDYEVRDDAILLVKTALGYLPR